MELDPQLPQGNGMNKPGVHALVWEGGWSHEQATRATGASAELDFDIIEIPRRTPKKPSSLN